uniref:CGL160/ATPI domain-containing protein n=1 Tax=Kalanchoe fedtschenkoi TaxID=63787 RepID=A0A7N0SX45_KALFE
MVVVNWVSVKAVSTPISPDSSSSSSLPSLPDPRQTKVILPKKKPQKWSTGMAPGEYGGPPTTTKLRKYWGGEEEDPITSDDFIWNKDFMERMRKLIQDPQESLPPSAPVKEESSGFLSLNRVMSLDSLEVDLSKELMTPLKAVAAKAPAESVNSGIKSPRWKLVPTRREQDKWDRAAKAATGGSDVMFRELRRPRGDPEVLAALSRDKYYKLKNKLQLVTLGVGGIGLVSAYVCYTPEIALSFGAGLLGSLAYIRMLGNTVDSLADGARGVMKGAAGQPRLLVPVVLVMIFNRWNEILVPEYGFMHLELIPMLVGFFTYKIATFAQAIEDTMTVVESDSDIAA